MNLLTGPTKNPPHATGARSRTSGCGSLRSYPSRCPVLVRDAAARLTLAGLVFAAAGGCVRRTMTIKTEPDGALVYLNDEEVGRSPVSVDFTWYGDYDIVIRHEDYETLKTHQRIREPWYQVPPIDFFAEVLVPFEIHDRRELFFELEPATATDREELLQRAAAFRERALYAEE